MDYGSWLSARKRYDFGMKILHKSSEQARTLIDSLAEIPWPSDDPTRPLTLLSRCPPAAETPLVRSPALAAQADVGEVFVKDERQRMGLGSFKALGAAYVIATDAEQGQAEGQTYVTASAGNHGLSVAAGAAAFGAKAVIFLAQTVPEAFAERLRSLTADVRRHGDTYEESMAGAQEAAAREGGILLSDSSWPGYTARPRTLMEGYLVLMHEVAAEIPQVPTHIFLQAGVGGLAAACAAHARSTWGESPRIVVVEPVAAPALFASVDAGTPQVTAGPVSAMGRLDCKEPSLIALKGLARDANDFVLISEAEGFDGHAACSAAGLSSTPSGSAGIAALLAAHSERAALDLSPTSRVLVVLSEDETS
jgi:diaminopropionate ammonia-lyase